jgi:hypothetical protein
MTKHIAANVSANNAVVVQAQKSIIYQNAKHHNGTTTIILFKNGSVVACRVKRRFSFYVR